MSNYTREIVKQFYGDQNLAAQYLGFARKLLGELADSTGDIENVQRRALLPDGARITVSFIAGLAKVAIDVRSVVTSTVTVCRTFLSGLLSPEQITSRTRKAPDGSDENYDVLEWIYPSDYQRLLTPAVPSPVAVESFASPKLTSASAGDHRMTVMYSSLVSSDYSGSMRQAIQLFLGMGAELVKDYIETGFGPPIINYFYNYGYNGTHGLVKKYGYTDTNPSFWLVRMPMDGYGILAMDFPVCNKVTHAEIIRGVHWVPVSVVKFPDDLPGAIKSGKVLELLSAVDFNAIIADYTPMYDDCGWAFSLSGHECQNVLYAVEEPTPNDYRVYTKRVKITFTPTKGWITASIKDLDQNIFFGPKAYIPRYPWYSSLYPTYDAYQAPHPTWNGTTDCAVHVFYSGEDEQVLRFHYTPGTATTTNEGQYWDAFGALDNVAFPIAGNYYGVTKAAGTTECYYSLNGTNINANTLSGSGTEYNIGTIVTGWPGAPYALGGTGGDRIMQTMESDVYKGNQWTRDFAGRINFVTAMIPIHQREGVFVLDARQDSTDTYTVDPGPVYVTSLMSSATLARIRGDADCDAEGYVESLEPIDLGPQTLPYGSISIYGWITGGGQQFTAQSGCISTIKVDIQPVRTEPGPSFSIPATASFSGSLKFYGSDAQVDISLGYSEEVTNNPVFAAIEQIFSTSYLDDGTSQFIFGYTDGIYPKDYVLSSTVNTVLGKDMVTNTNFPIEKMDVWVKSFVGITN